MSGRCGGLHCDGCRHGGASAAAGIGMLVVLIGVLVYAAHHGAIDHAATDTVHVLVDVLVITAITLTVAAVTAGTVWAVRARQRARRQAVAPLSVRVIRSCAASARPAVEPVRLALPGQRPTLATRPEALFLDANTREERSR
jgi:heme/copper-type cytochrome/quinol oxidase subunit 2